jgi:hypothetical protein
MRNVGGGEGFFAFAEIGSPKGSGGNTVLLGLSIKDKKTGGELFTALQQVSLEDGQKLQSVTLALILPKALGPGEYLLEAKLVDATDLFHPVPIGKPITCTYTKK